MPICHITPILATWTVAGGLGLLALGIVGMIRVLTALRSGGWEAKLAG